MKITICFLECEVKDAGPQTPWGDLGVGVYYQGVLVATGHTLGSAVEKAGDLLIACKVPGAKRY